MQSQCPICRGVFEIRPEWIGQPTQCPYCRQNIIIQAAQNVQPPYANQYPTVPVAADNKSTGALVCGIISLFLWLLPILGLPISIVGLVLGCRNKYQTGIVLNAIGLALSLLNAVVGALLALSAFN